jgi:hypothetical protein
MNLTGREVLAAIRRKYSSECREWSLQDGHHSKLPADASRLMVWYTTDSGITGRQWAETVVAWANGDVDYYYDHEHGLN